MSGKRSVALIAAVAALAVGAWGHPEHATAGPPVGMAQSFATHCDVQTLTAGKEGNVWFTCPVETDYGYGSRVRFGRVTPGGAVTEFGSGLPDDMEPGQIVTAADGNLWFPLSSLPNQLPPKKRQPPMLVRVTPDGAGTVYEPDLGHLYEINDIVASPNGNLWFTSTFWEGGKEPALWQVSPNTVITRLPIDLGDAAPELEVGPEGDLWFTKKPASGGAAKVIAHLAPDGALSEYGTATPGFAARSPLLGPDGAIWFFSANSTASGALVAPAGVSRILPGGELADTGAKLDTGGGIVGGSTIGSDGNLWFGFQSGTLGKSAIERVSPGGEVSVFRDCLRYSQPFFGPASLATGADGNVWFTSVASRMLPGLSDPPSIGRITPSGEIAQIYAGVEAEPKWILAGPDGAIWFSAGNDEIQRIAPLTGPINTFHVGPLKRAARSGAATARVAVPGPGTVRLKPLALLLRHHRRVRLHGGVATASAASCTTARLRVKPVGAALKAFHKRGEAIEKVAVTFTPTGGTPYTEVAKLDFFAPRPRHRR
jgi:virginiamycin B lyase